MTPRLSCLALAAALVLGACAGGPGVQAECCIEAQALKAQMSECCRDNVGKAAEDRTGCCVEGMAPDATSRPDCCAETLALVEKLPDCCVDGLAGDSEEACCENMEG